MQKVFVLDKQKNPLMPCHPARARKLLKASRAVVVRRAPFVIRLKDRIVEESGLQPVRLKIDPGSKVTGLAIVREDGDQAQVLHLAELQHKRGVAKAMEQRNNYRRRRRTANLRYRPPRFLNRAASRRKGRRGPCMQTRLNTIETWVNRYRKWCPITAISEENAAFDTQKMVHPEISGIEYQQGTLYEYELKEYLLEKWGRKCAYCDREDVILEKEHIWPRSRGGPDRVSNLTISCPSCNQKKGNQDICDFLAHDPERLKWILAQTQQPLRDAAAMNATRWAVWRMLQETGLPVEVGTGGRTKFNRTQHGLPKTHAYDALCVGASTPDRFIELDNGTVLTIKACGRGKRQMVANDAYGFPRKGYKPRRRQKRVFDFGTGDLVRKVRGKYAGSQGALVARTNGAFYFSQNDGERISISHRQAKLLQRFDGYMYGFVTVG